MAFPLYSMKDQIKMRDLCWISCFCCFSDFFNAFHILFMKSATFHTKSGSFYENKQNWVNMCVYMHHLHNMHHMHHQIPPKYKIYLVGLLSYSMKDQVKMRDLCWISCFCYFSGAFQCFSCTFNEKCHFSWKQTKPGQYVCIHAPFTHTCTTKYHQNIIYT